ncbi:MAG TPA: hypothetical protein VLA46_07285 [Saprospiraceae bacterium]|nr:hypothetical protein [Saprospiraceae bacterium]
MKKVLFSFFLFSVMAVGVQAQKSACSKSCTAKPAAGVSSCEGKSASVATTGGSDAAAKLAAMDASIETKTCPVTGTVSYVRKETCAGSGTVSYVDVNYDAATNTFVNVSPMKMEGNKDCGTKGTSANGKSCCAGKSTATSTSGSTGKSCCAGKPSAATTTSGKAVKTASPSKD